MTDAVAEAGGPPLEEKTLLGHPRGLVVLFFTEMWERFSYYGMRGLLILYLTQHFLFSDDRSSLIYGAYVSLVYVMSILGGMLADRYLGQGKAVTFGAVLLVLGHFGMAFEGTGSKEIASYQGVEFEITLDGRGGDATPIVVSSAGQSEISFADEGKTLIVADPAAVGLPERISVSAYDSRIERQSLYVNILYLSLALIIAGVGFLKPNISTIVGDLYGVGDARRDSGFTLFYMGINLGSLLSALTCGYLGIAYGWKYGFGLAGIGMLLGLVTFITLQHWLEGKADPPDPDKLKQSVFGPINVEWACYLSALGIIGFSILLIMNADYAAPFLGIVGVVMLIALIVYANVRLDTVERPRLFAALYFSLAQIPFWSLFEQAGSSLNLFTDRLVDRELFGMMVPAPMFQFLNAGYIVLFAPLVAWLWTMMAKRRVEPSTPVKFAIGVFGVGLGYLALVGGMNSVGADLMTPVIFIFLIYWIHTMAELMVSPVGLSAMTKLAPARAVGLVMGIWFLYTGLSNTLAGVISAAAGAKTIGGQIVDPAGALGNYISVYSNIAYIAMAIAVVMLLISPIIKGWMKGAD
ncbi:MAG: peptide MFS transporter [Henriciella sp.]|nr:peptide MFS transporter [Henriciella sp.]